MNARRLGAALAAIGLLATALPVAAEPLGRLFFTPERRATLERQRQLNIQEAQTLEGATMSLDGLIVRSSGKRTAWINQRPQHDTDPGAGASATPTREPGRAVVTAGEEIPAELRVGETINRATRESRDVIGDGRISIRRPAAGR